MEIPLEVYEKGPEEVFHFYAWYLIKIIKRLDDAHLTEWENTETPLGFSDILKEFDLALSNLQRVLPSHQKAVFDRLSATKIVPTIPMEGMPWG